MWHLLKGMAVLLCGTAVAGGVTFAVWFWPILFKSDFMLLWGWIGFIPAIVVGLITWNRSLRYFARKFGVATFGEKDVSRS
jgi:hypothetical protein